MLWGEKKKEKNYISDPPACLCVFSLSEISHVAALCIFLTVLIHEIKHK